MALPLPRRPAVGHARLCAGVLALAAAACLCWCPGVRAAQDAPPVDDDYVDTLLRGVDDHCARIHTVEGTAYCVGSYSDLIRRKFPEWNDVPPGRELGSQDLQCVAFAIDYPAGMWQLQAAELVSAGFDPLGVICAWGLPTAFEEVDEPWRRPQVCWACDGETETRYGYATGEVREAAAGPDAERPGLLLELERYLGTLFGADARAFEADRPGEARLGGTETIANLECREVFCEYQADAGPGRTAMWVAPDNGFLVTRIEDFAVERETPTRGYRWVFEVRAAKPYGEGIWLPVEVVRHEYTYLPGEPAAWRQSALFVSRDLRANEPVDWPRVRRWPLLGMKVYRHTPEPQAAIWGGADRLLRDFAGGHLLVPHYDDEAAQPLTGHEFEHLLRP